jgi:hypothetical protein
LVHNARLLLLLSGYSETSYTDQTGVGDLENFFATVLFREDFRDYYRREGLYARLVYKAHSQLRLAAGYRVDEYESMNTNANWSFAKGDFAPNPPVHEGLMRSLISEVRWGTDYNHLDVQYEKCGDDLAGGDFGFEQLTAQARFQTYVGPSQRIDARVKYGGALSGWLPNQRRYLAGGLGTVRGYDYQSLMIPSLGDSTIHGGQQLLLFNAEYKFDLGFGWAAHWYDDDDDDWGWDWGWDHDLDFDIAVFFDAGMVWEDKNADITVQDLKSSAGVGFLFGGDDGLRLDVIQVLDGSDEDLSVQVRIDRVF